jgi:hypothetical protein
MCVRVSALLSALILLAASEQSGSAATASDQRDGPVIQIEDVGAGA